MNPVVALISRLICATLSKASEVCLAASGCRGALTPPPQPGCHQLPCLTFLGNPQAPELLA